MFTGIIEATAKIINRNESGIIVSRPEKFTDITVGQSIAVNGACLTVVEFKDDSLWFDVVPETFRRTNLGIAETVNLERALAANGRFEGHVVLGHVDAIMPLISRAREGNGERFIFRLPPELSPYFTEKGSVCLNGISLTIADLDSEKFSIAVIPHTLEETNFKLLKIGDEVNVEAEYFAKLLFKWREPMRDKR